MLPALRGLLAYTIWADRQILQVMEGVSAEDLARETGTSFGSVLGTMIHVLGGEQLWLSRLLGVPLQRLPDIGDLPDLASLRASFEDFWPQLEVYLASLNDEQLDSELTWTSLEGETRTAPFRQVLLHVVNHSTYHRGQVAAQLRQLGHQAPPTDLISWRGSF